jgi:hypothetical protein
MDNSFHRQGSDTQQQGGFFAASLQIFNRFVNWLGGFIKLTEAEKKDAGIYLGDQRYK